MKKEEVDQIKCLLAAGDRVAAIKVLEGCPDVAIDEMLLLQLGELYYAEGRMTEALNKFNAVVRLNPDNRKALNYVTMIRSIIDYYNKDLLNP